jgi:hypothetical protein
MKLLIVTLSLFAALFVGALTGADAHPRHTPTPRHSRATFTPLPTRTATAYPTAFKTSVPGGTACQLITVNRSDAYWTWYCAAPNGARWYVTLPANQRPY